MHLTQSIIIHSTPTPTITCTIHYALNCSWIWTVQFLAMTWSQVRYSIIDSPLHPFFAPSLNVEMHAERNQYMLLQLKMMHFSKLNLGSSPPVVSENSCSVAELLVRFWETFWLSPGWFIINEIWPLAARQNYHLTLSLCNNGPKLCCRAIRRQHRLHHHHHPDFNHHHQYHPQLEQQNRHIESHLH